MDGHKKITYTNFQIFLENLFGSNGRNRHGTMRAVVDSFEVYIINSLMKKKKKIETNSIMSRALFRVAQLKQKKIEITFLSNSLKWKNSLRTKFFSQFCFQNFYQKYAYEYGVFTWNRGKKLNIVWLYTWWKSLTFLPFSIRYYSLDFSWKVRIRMRATARAR